MLKLVKSHPMSIKCTYFCKEIHQTAKTVKKKWATLGRPYDNILNIYIMILIRSVFELFFHKLIYLFEL